MWFFVVLESNSSKYKRKKSHKCCFVTLFDLYVLFFIS